MVSKPAGSRPRGRGAALLVAAAVIVSWNVVFDGRVKAAVWEYVDRQQLYVAGLAEPADVDAVMRAGVARGLRDATLAGAAAGALAAALLGAARR